MAHELTCLGVCDTQLTVQVVGHTHREEPDQALIDEYHSSLFAMHLRVSSQSGESLQSRISARTSAVLASRSLASDLHLLRQEVPYVTILYIRYELCLGRLLSLRFESVAVCRYQAA